MRGATLVVIPARLASTRLPGKMLKPLGAFPVVEWCRRAAVRAAVGPVVVATDSREVLRAVESFGGTAVLTPEDCRSGTDRVHAAVQTIERALRRRPRRGRCRAPSGWALGPRRRFPFVLNLQGDEPFIRPRTVRGVAALLWRGAAMSTAVVPLEDPSDLENPSVVKAAMAGDGRCLYFSRAPIPFFSRAHASSGGRAPRVRHIGIYGFSRSALDRFVSLPPSPLEKAESLEQLRALEAGIPITAFRAWEKTAAIDTASDLARARKLLHG